MLQSYICLRQNKILETSMNVKRKNCKTQTKRKFPNGKERRGEFGKKNENEETLTLLEEMKIMHEGIWVVTEWDQRKERKNHTSAENFAVEAFILGTNLCQLCYYYYSLVLFVVYFSFPSFLQLKLFICFYFLFLFCVLCGFLLWEKMFYLTH